MSLPMPVLGTQSHWWSHWSNPTIGDATTELSMKTHNFAGPSYARTYSYAMDHDKICKKLKHGNPNTNGLTQG